MLPLSHIEIVNLIAKIYYRCLEKNADNRPFMQEIIEHPFFTEIPADDHHVSNHAIENKFNIEYSINQLCVIQLVYARIKTSN